MVTIWSLVAVLAAALTYAFPVWPDDGSGSNFTYDSGNADVHWHNVGWWDDYPYMLDGEGVLSSGSGMGYFGSDVSWETTSGEVNGGKKAVFIFELDYDEQGDSTGKDHAYLYLTFRVYKWTGSEWELVGDDTDYVYNDTYTSTYTMHVNYEFDSSVYKFRFIQKSYLDEPQIDQMMVTEITDERHSTTSDCLFIDD